MCLCLCACLCACVGCVCFVARAPSIIPVAIKLYDAERIQHATNSAPAMHTHTFVFAETSFHCRLFGCVPVTHAPCLYIHAIIAACASKTTTTSSSSIIKSPSVCVLVCVRVRLPPDRDHTVLRSFVAAANGVAVVVAACALSATIRRRG